MVGVQLQQAQLQKRIKVWEAVHLGTKLYNKRVEVATHSSNNSVSPKSATLGS